MQERVIRECVRLLHDRGSICWQVGNYVENGEIVPIDTLLYPLFRAQGLKLRNRIIWHFGHGLHCKNRLSGRYETINWWTKGEDYTWNLDPIRVPYPNKRHFKGPNVGKLSGNPKGKNPSDVWEFPNVKSNHPEKTSHPCQFPVELVERLVLSLTHEGDRVFDPFMTLACREAATREPLNKCRSGFQAFALARRPVSGLDGAVGKRLAAATAASQARQAASRRLTQRKEGCHE